MEESKWDFETIWRRWKRGKERGGLDCRWQSGFVCISVGCIGYRWWREDETRKLSGLDEILLDWWRDFRKIEIFINMDWTREERALNKVDRDGIGVWGFDGFWVGWDWMMIFLNYLKCFNRILYALVWKFR